MPEKMQLPGKVRRNLDTFIKTIENCEDGRDYKDLVANFQRHVYSLERHFDVRKYIDFLDSIGQPLKPPEYPL